ncbi:MAG TPA: hypothetical protein PLO51_02155 [Candidatus Micrarchaeota archaeon]|nr:hypothetical protein [Candidatus Micrarchaeota archaeon]
MAEKNKNGAFGRKKGFIFSALAVLAIAAVLVPAMLASGSQPAYHIQPNFQAREAALALGQATPQPVFAANGTATYRIGPYLSDSATSPEFEKLLELSGKQGSYKAYFGPKFDFGIPGMDGQFRYDDMGKRAYVDSLAWLRLRRIEVSDCAGCRIAVSGSSITRPAYSNFTLSAGGQDAIFGVPFVQDIAVVRGNATVLSISYSDYSGTLWVEGSKMGSASFYFELPQDMLIYPEKTMLDNGVPAWVSG